MSRKSFTLVFIVVCCLSSCDATVDPFLETDRYFTLFGTLDMARDTQFVRVIPLRGSLMDTSRRSLDVKFTSEDLTSGITRVWSDSIVIFDGGKVGHIFYAPIRIISGHTYRIEVSKGDSISRAETAVPPRPTPVVVPPELFEGVFATGTQTVHWQQVLSRPFSIQVIYRFLPVSSGNIDAAPVDIIVPATPEVDSTFTGWKITIDLDENRVALDTLTNPSDFPLLGLAMRITLLDEAFEPPGGEFDSDLQSHPGTFSNVTNGFGFIGSVGRYSTEWAFTKETTEALDYVTLQDVFGKRKVDRIRQHLNLQFPTLAE